MLQLPKEFNSYKPHVTFQIDTEVFTIKTAETKKELTEVFKLRNNTFYKERKNLPPSDHLKIDPFDIHADQLIILNKNDQKVVGTYRLIPSSFVPTKHFGNWDFFDMSHFLNNKMDTIIEMEWACIQKNFRGVKAIHHIWLGLARYFQQTKSRYMCGQVNILKSSAEEVACIYNIFLDKQLLDKENLVFPKKKYAISNFDELISKNPANKKSWKKLSRLFLWYLKLGAKIHGYPIYDPDFNSYGFFISLDFKNMKHTKLIKRYKDAAYLK